MNGTGLPLELDAFAVGFDTPKPPTTPVRRDDTADRFQASTRYTTSSGRLSSSWSAFSRALRLGLLEARSDNDLSCIVRSLKGLNDRQLRILGFDRQSLVEEVRELVLIDEGQNHERGHDGAPELKAVHAALRRSN